MKFIYNGIFILMVFISGYLLGKVDMETMLYKMLVKYQQLDFIQIIGFGSSIITLILFLTYIVGRYFLIKKMEITLEETVEVLYENKNDRFNVIDEYNLGGLNSEFVYLSSTEPLRWVKFYEYNFNDENNYKGKLLEEHKILKNGHALKINTYLTCGIPNYLIEYQRFDYIKGELILAEDGKNGNAGQNVMIKHTFKSILYYLINK